MSNLIKDAPHDRRILVYGYWNWEKLEHTGQLDWRVAIWNSDIGFDWENDTVTGGFSSVTSNPYADYSYGIYWAELPIPGE